MPANPTPEREFTGWHMAITMIAFFGVIISVNLTMAILASSTWTGLIVKNGYVASQDFNKNLEQADAQNALGWKSSFDYAGGEIRFGLVDRDGTPVAINTATALLSRPSHENGDHAVPLAALLDGVMHADHTLDPGGWIIRIDARSVDGNAFRQSFRFDVQ